MASKLEAFAKKNGVKYFLFNFTAFFFANASSLLAMTVSSFSLGR